MVKIGSFEGEKKGQKGPFCKFESVCQKISINIGIAYAYKYLFVKLMNAIGF